MRRSFVDFLSINDDFSKHDSYTRFALSGVFVASPQLASTNAID